MSKNNVSFFDFSFHNIIPIIIRLIFLRCSFPIWKTEYFLEAFVSLFARFFCFIERFRAAAAEFVFWNSDGQAAAVSDFLSRTDFDVGIAIIREFEDAFATLSIVPHECHPVEGDKDVCFVFFIKN